jgi:hypothetical protein
MTSPNIQLNDQNWNTSPVGRHSPTTRASALCAVKTQAKVVGCHQSDKELQ